MELWEFSKEGDVMELEGDEEQRNCMLSLREDIPLNGRIVSVQSFRPNEEEKDRLFFLSEHRHFCVLGYNEHEKKVTTFSCGDLSSAIGRVPDAGFKCVKDPQNRMIGMVLLRRAYEIAAYASKWRVSGSVR